MFPVRRARRDASATTGIAGGVLPRAFRRPVRHVARVLAGEITVPRLAASGLMLGLFVATGLYGAYVGGRLPDLVGGVTARSGFAVAQLSISGNRDTSEIDIIGALGLDGHTSLVGLGAISAREKVEALPWVERASVRKVYPGTVEIRVEERVPFAVWQRDGELMVIERSGAPIAPFAGTRHARLPLIVGRDAPELAPAFLARVMVHPALASRVTGYVRVGGRRWDLRVDDRITIRLPENGEDAALAELARLDAEKQLFSADIVEVDMRLADRVSVRLSPEAAEMRAETVKARLKAMRGGRSI